MLETFDCRIRGDLELGHALGCHAELRTDLHADEDYRHRRNDIGAALGDPLRGLSIDQSRMLDAADAALDRTASGADWMAMRRYIGSALGAFVDDRADLVFAELIHPHRVARRHDPARRGNFDAMGSAAQLFARCLD